MSARIVAPIATGAASFPLPAIQLRIAGSTERKPLRTRNRPPSSGSRSSSRSAKFPD